ncbi:hypothetical protein BJN42_21795 [Pseudomonas koreensis]|jgi:hypothetical protein|uniref:Uncharacterized protein n=1 Tax=Pseudomonas fluorescens TaxID=294 RepID=A0A5E7L2V4_PSEFL|nr:hypothetical protein [Pseudomonas fluorescens]OFJ43301.1 hypothetical protein BJN42_21795 [Pseudomonas koreensis]VVP06543.1 hypothetical protein PS896_03102 [Pseudomonas fluorescens]
MANRSNKVVLSARVDPYLKAALELLAASQKEKIVKLLETFLENGMHDFYVVNPFLPKGGEAEKTSFMNVFTAIWSDDEVVYKLRAGVLGPQYAGETAWRQAMVVTGDHYFKGADDLYGDLNGLSEKWGYKAEYNYFLDLEKVRSEWPLIEGYVSFIENNKPFEPSYEDYKRMHQQSKAK